MTKSETNSVREAIARDLGSLDLLIHCTDTDLLEIADAALAAIEAAGWQCVPKELTVPMGKAWVALDCEMKSIEDCYRAMLAAAPKPGGEK